jgi:hypothetical protein
MVTVNSLFLGRLWKVTTPLTHRNNETKTSSFLATPSPLSFGQGWKTIIRWDIKKPHHTGPRTENYSPISSITCASSSRAAIANIRKVTRCQNLTVPTHGLVFLGLILRCYCGGFTARPSADMRCIRSPRGGLISRVGFPPSRESE